MIRSKYHLVAQLTDLLLEFSGIVNAFQAKSSSATLSLSAWMQRAEDLLSSHRLPQAARLAGVKAKMMAASTQDERNGATRRRQIQAAIACLDDAQQCLQDALHPQAAKVEQARDVLRNLLQIVAHSGAIRYEPKYGIAALIEQIRELCANHDQLKAHVVQLRSWLSLDDLRLLMAEEIEPADFGASADGAVTLNQARATK